MNLHKMYINPVTGHKKLVECQTLCIAFIYLNKKPYLYNELGEPENAMPFNLPSFPLLLLFFDISRK